MKLSEANRPLRVFDKAMQGGLGAGNIGLLMSGHGTGKVGVLTAITLDHAINGRRVLHVAIGKPVSDIRAYQDEVLHEILQKIDVGERPDLITKVERHRQIYTYVKSAFGARKLRETLAFLANHGEFRPELIDIQGWPDFATMTPEELQELKKIAEEFKTELWLTAHTQSGDRCDARGVPEYVARFDDAIAVIVALEPRGNMVALRFTKTHNAAPPNGIHLEFDPHTHLIYWR